MIEKFVPHFVAFGAALTLTLVLTPIVREFNRRFGMVDKPDPRRINKVPIPRGGGLALFLGTAVSYSLLVGLGGEGFAVADVRRFLVILVLSSLMVAVGYADDKLGLNPKVKLLGQLVVAGLTWGWADLGFRDIWPSLPAWIDAPLTVFWIVGAVNAFNLIDGLDGLASGLALIATLGMCGAQAFAGRFEMTVFYFAFMGALFGFLRYNWNPASVFLGDSGSMFIGYTLAILALGHHSQDSLLVSVGVPLLAMGVPIFDTSLAILRRSIRRILNRSGSVAGNGQVMTADTDHLHHRILRAAGLNQRKAAVSLYALAAFLVVVGLVGISLQSRASGLWLAAFAVAAVVVCRDMSRVELFDAGLLLNRVARARDTSSRRRWARLSVPLYLTGDVLALVLVYLFCCWVAHLPLTEARLRTAMPIQVIATFASLVFFRTYVTVWARALVSNYVRLFLACATGSVVGCVAIYYLPSVPAEKMRAMMILYAVLPFLAILMLRVVRQIVRDLFYALDCRRLIGRKDVSRVLVYGTGLRYRAFRRELVRTTAANDRMIVGLLDDDILLRNHYIGGLQVKGTLHDAAEVINALNVDAVVIAFAVTPEKEKVIREFLEPTGVKVTKFTFGEESV